MDAGVGRDARTAGAKATAKTTARTDARRRSPVAVPPRCARVRSNIARDAGGDAGGCDAASTTRAGSFSRGFRHCWHPAGRLGRANARKAHTSTRRVGVREFRTTMRRRRARVHAFALVLTCVLMSLASRARAREIEENPRRGRALRQILAPARYSAVSFRDALYELGEALVDLALVPIQFRWVDEINARARATPEPEDVVDAYEIRDDLVYAGDPYEIAAEDRDDRVVRQWLREAAQNDGE